MLQSVRLGIGGILAIIDSATDLPAIYKLATNDSATSDLAIINLAIINLTPIK